MIYGFLYSSFMKFIHLFGFHYAPPRPIIKNGEKVGLFAWCHWCGMRDEIIVVTKKIEKE